jgi:hypothetical protein
MTILIGTVAKNNIVLTADGLSRANPITGAGMECGDLQKIFPHGTSPVAIVHHGLNIINRKPTDQRVADFYKFLAEYLEASTLKQIANKFIDFIDDDANATFNDPSNKGIIGFWIAGFSWRQTRPELFEICWPDSITPSKFAGLIIGGDAQKFLDPYPHQLLRSYSPAKSNIEKYSVTFAVAYNNVLYMTAERLQKASGEMVFGGHKHQLVIKSSGCSWTKSPT